MKYQKVIIIGSPGSGKTTLARSIADATGLPIIHLDRLYWRAGWNPVAEEEFDRLLAEALAQPAWIADGNYSRSLPVRLEACDLVIYLDFPRSVCLMGAIKRIVCSFGRTRPDMGEDCPERFDLEFLRYIWNFPNRQREKLATILNAFPEKELVILHRRRELDGLAEQLSAEA